MGIFDVDGVQQVVAESEFTDAELNEMRSLLDDPDVTAENKQNMLYVLSNANRLSDAEINRYSAEVGADADDVRSGGEALRENMDNARTSLPAAREDGWRASARDTQNSVQNAQQMLDQGGFSNSDEIIDEAQLAVKLFEDFHPRYERAGGLGGSGMPSQPEDRGVVTVDQSSMNGSGSTGMPATYSHSGVDPRSIEEGMDEFRGIDFTAFRADAETLTTAHIAVTDSKEALDSSWSSNAADWTGDAKSAAEQVNNALVRGAGDLSQALRTAPENITYTVDNAIQQNVINFAQSVLDLYGDGTVAELTPLQVDAFITAKEDLPALIEELEAKIEEIENKSLWDKFVDLMSSPLTAVVTVISPIGALIGYSYASEITEDNIREETDKYRGTLQEAEQRLAEFCADYDTKANSVHQQASSYVSGIQDNYTTLIDSLNQGLEPDPFAATDTGGDAGGDTGGGVDTGGTGNGTGSGSGSGSGGGGSVPGVGGGGTGGGGSMPGIETPETEKPEGMNPVTGKPLELNPETGEPYPIDPETGEAIKDLGSDQDTLTVEQGDQTFTMTEPDDEGKMDISVEDGSGELKEYQLDFGPDDPSAAEPGEFGPQGTGEPGEQVYRPGPDGKIHIEDGNLKITAERPEGPEGPTVVTVDNGQGEPVTYTLGTKEPDGSAEALRDRVTTQPGRADAGQPVPGAAGDESGSQSGATGAQNADAAAGGGAASGGAAAGGGAAPAGDSTPAGDAAPAGDSGAGGAAAGAAPSFAADSGSVGVGSVDGGADNAAGSVPGSEATTAQTVGAGGDSGGGAAAVSGGGGSEPLGAGAFSGADSQPAPAAAGGGLGVAPGGTGAEGMASAGAQGGGMAGGMGMMGGMGAMGGAGGGQGGDQERSSNPYRLDGGIFETSGSANRISGSLADDADRSIRFDR
ncbi:hypothetical protein ABZ863_00285 [Saccharomonospora sp. NPDC046836]|uniref:hypothetical protein n=1 Tax=Saccharomonospora sp. NPDC046836 TaxID=3156921 RepID=UPI0033DB65DE